MAGQPQLRVREIDGGLLARIGFAIRLPAAFCRSVAAASSSRASATTTSSKRSASSTKTVTRSGSACMKPSLVASSSRDSAPSLTHVRPQDARLQRREKRRVLRKYAFFAFGRHGDDQLRIAVEDDLRRRDELERDAVSHEPCARAFSLTSSIVPA